MRYAVPDRPKLRDVARHARVSVATVSRVLNNSGPVAEITRRRIDASIEALSYAPDPLARAFNAGRSRTVGVVIPTLDHAIFARYVDALEARLRTHGFALVMATCNQEPALEEERAASLLRLGVEALVLSGMDERAGIDALAERHGVPVLLTSVHDPDAPHPSVGYDNAGLAGQAVTHLTELGHRRIAVIHGPTVYNDRTRLRLKGAMAAAGEVDCALRPIATELSEAGGEEAAKALLREPEDVTAILCLSDVIAMGALFALIKAGVPVPDEMSLMGFDNLKWSALTHPPLTTIDLPVVEMGEVAADSIASHLERGLPLQGALLPADLVVRGSTAPPRR